MSTAIFTVVTGILYTPLPTENGNRVVAVSSVDPMRGAKPRHLSYPDYITMREGNKTFESLEAIKDASVNVLNEGQPRSYHTAFTTAGMLGMLQTSPIIGRDFVEADNTPGAEMVVILEYNVWRNDFEEDPEVVGKSLRVDNRMATVIGVLPSTFVHPLIPGIWVPLIHDHTVERENRGHRDLHVWGLLKEGTDLSRARADIAVIAQRNADQYSENDGIGSVVQPFIDKYIPGEIFYSAYALMFASVGLVLLISCSTVANLMLGSAVQRRFEMATRAALGATRGQIIRQLLTESVCLSAIGGILGLFLSLSLLKALERFGPEMIRPYGHLFSTDYRVFGFLAVISLACGILFRFGARAEVYANRPDDNLE